MKADRLNPTGDPLSRFAANRDSTPSPRATAIGLRATAFVIYVGVVAAAFATLHDSTLAVILTTAVPIVAALVVLADLVDRGGRVR